MVTLSLTQYERAECVAAQVLAELRKAMEQHAPQSSAHESYAVILEEVDEFWEEVKKKRSERSNEAMLMELRQIAAMSIRAIVDLRLDSNA